MFINKKITAALAAMVMALTSFSAFTVASADGLPTVTVEKVEKADLIHKKSDMGVKFTISNLSGKTCDMLTFCVKLPKDFVNYYDSDYEEWSPVTSAAEMGNIVKAAKNTPFAVATTKNFVLQSEENGLVQYKATFGADVSTPFTDGSSVEFDFGLNGADFATAPVGSFAISDVKLRYKGDKDAFGGDAIAVTNNAEVKGGAAETTPVITPAEGQSDYEAAAAFTGYADATKVGNYTGDVADDKATAFKATVSGTSTTGDVIWKVTDGVDTKYHKMSVGNIFAGGGNAVIGLAVEGLADGSASVAFLK